MAAPMLTRKRFRDEDQDDEQDDFGFDGFGSKRKGDPSSFGGAMKEGGDSKSSATSQSNAGNSQAANTKAK